MFFKNKYRYYYILALAVYTYINTAICEIYFYFNLQVHWYQALTIIFLITLGSWESNRLLHPLIQKLFPADNINKHAIIYFLSGFFISCLLTIIIDVVFGMLMQQRPISQLRHPLEMTLTYTGLINLLFHLINTIFLYQQGYRKKSIESEALKRMHMQAELLAIKQQINPHFLFNNLNVLSGLVMQQSNEANTFIEAFSQVYMHILNTHNKELVELKEELKYLKPYMYLLQQRFPGTLQIETDIPEKYTNQYIIPVALQMLVENAIKHNVASAKKPLCIRMYINDAEMLVVENQVQARASIGKSSQSGLKNIEKRYQLITGKTIGLARTERMFSIMLPLIEINAYESINN